jgi:uncharacterized protein (UPF0548 family)
MQVQRIWTLRVSFMPMLVFILSVLSHHTMLRPRQHSTMMPWRTQICLVWLLVCHVDVALASTGPKRAQRYDAISLSRSKIVRWRQRTTNQKINKRLPIVKASVSSASEGSLLTLQRPTTERVSRWFWGKDTVFNHASVGMTNPCLHIAVNDNDQDDDCYPNNPLTAAIPVSLREDHNMNKNMEELWWPKTACPIEQTSWRVLRYRSRVGRGSECYQRVRDAALQWEFSSPGQDKGMMQVTPCASSSSSNHHRGGRHGQGYTVLPLSELDDIYAPVTSDQIMKIWSGPGRRLVSFTATGLDLRLPKWMPRLPRLYSINPVAVVYDLVDERGPATTYSATAYATVKGHLLRGEERVTVALRDSGHVDVEILSFSKPAASAKGRLVWPVIGGMQNTFFEQQMISLERVAQSQEEFEESPVSGMIRIH